MQQPGMRFSLGSSLIAVAAVAILLTLIRWTERQVQLMEIDQLSSMESMYRNNEYITDLNKEYIETMARKRLAIEGRLGVMPRTLSVASIAVTVGYLRAVVLWLVVRSERRGWNPIGRESPKRFRVWLLVGLVAPALILALGILFEQHLTWGGNQGVARTIGWLAVIQIFHALAGVIILRRRRWATLAIGFFSVLATASIAVFAAMAVTPMYL